MSSVEIHIETRAVEPRYGIRAMRVPGGGGAQGRLKEMLVPLGVKVAFWDGVVEQLEAPVNGSLYQWRSLHIEGVYRSARVGDWIVAYLGRFGQIRVQTMTDEEFNAMYREVQS